MYSHDETAWNLNSDKLLLKYCFQIQLAPLEQGEIAAIVALAATETTNVETAIAAHTAGPSNRPLFHLNMSRSPSTRFWWVGSNGDGAWRGLGTIFRSIHPRSYSFTGYRVQ
jgi:hypothetical protein